MHHVIARSVKDLVCRYRTMRGNFVLRRGGWDTHGLPVEIEVEKQLPALLRARGMSEEDKQKIIGTREAQIAKGGYAFGARVNALLAANASPKTIELVREVVRATSPRGFMHGVKLGMVDGYAPEEVAPKLNFPVLMISGREDRVNPIDKNAAVLIKQLPQGRLEILEGAGHLPEVEKPEVVNKLLREFFG